MTSTYANTEIRNPRRAPDVKPLSWQSGVQDCSRVPASDISLLDADQGLKTMDELIMTLGDALAEIDGSGEQVGLKRGEERDEQASTVGSSAGAKAQVSKGSDQSRSSRALTVQRTNVRRSRGVKDDLNHQDGPGIDACGVSGRGGDDGEEGDDAGPQKPRKKQKVSSLKHAPSAKRTLLLSCLDWTEAPKAAILAAINDPSLGWGTAPDCSNCGMPMMPYPGKWQGQQYCVACAQHANSKGYLPGKTVWGARKDRFDRDVTGSWAKKLQAARVKLENAEMNRR